MFSTTFTTTKNALGLIAASLAAAVTVTGCTTSGHGALPNPVPTIATAAAVRTAAAAVDTSAKGGVTVTTGAGYQFRIALATPGVSSASSFTTDDGSGTGGTAIDAPPGASLVVANLTVTNATDRAEPLSLVGIGALPESVDAGLTLAVPVADAGAFGLDASYQSAYCGTTGEFGTALAPVGYCALTTTIGAFTPAQGDITAPPQLSPGQAGTVTLLGAGTSIGVPQTAPIGDATVFVQPSPGHTAWSRLG